MLPLKIMGRSITHRVATMPMAVFTASNFRSPNIVAPGPSGQPFCARPIRLHDLWDVLFVEVVDFVHGVPDADQGGNDRARARAEHQVELLPSRQPIMPSISFSTPSV